METTTKRPTKRPAAAPTTQTQNTDAAQPAQPARPAIWLQVVLPGGSTQPTGIPLDVPEWERLLDDAVNQIRLLVLRELLAAARAAPAQPSSNGH